MSGHTPWSEIRHKKDSPVRLARVYKDSFGEISVIARALLDAEKTLQGISDETTELRVRARANRALSVLRGSE